MTTIDELKNYNPGGVRIIPSMPDSLLEFAKAVGHGSDHVESFEIDDEKQIFNVDFSWSVRGSYCDERYSDVPLSILFSQDIEKAAKFWDLGERRKKILSEISGHENSIRWEKEQLAKIDEKIKELK
jgi:hypothetical protein